MLTSSTRLTGVREHIGAEALVAKDGKTLFQAELKPVATGDAVAGPVVEIFVGHHSFDLGVVGVGGDLGPRKDEFRVEDVEALVLHGPHVEIVDGNDHIDIEIVFAAVDRFVPLHGALQRGHGMFALVDVVALDIDAQDHIAAGQRDEAILDILQIPRTRAKR